MTESAHRLRAISIGMFRTRPPSARIISSRTTGANAPGIDMLARIAVARSPSSSTTMLLETMSVATARYGIGSLSKSVSSRARATYTRSRSSTLLVLTRPAGTCEAVGRDAELELIAVRGAGALLLDGFEIAAALAADHPLPVDGDQEFFELVSRYAGGITAADERAHAGAGDAIDRHAQFFQHLQHADVRAALRATAGEHEADARPAGDVRRFRGTGRSDSVPARRLQAERSHWRWRGDCMCEYLVSGATSFH